MRSPRPGGGIDRFGHHERLAVALVEPLGQVPGQLQVLALIVADRHPVGVVEQDVGGHEHRVGEQPDPGRLLALLGRLVLELRHAPQLTHAGRALQQPGQLGVGRHVALHEQRAGLRVQAGGEQQGRHGQGGLAQRRRGPRARSGRGGRRRNRSCRPGAGPRPTTAPHPGSCPGAVRRSAGCPRALWSPGHGMPGGGRPTGIVVVCPTR